MNLTYMEIFNAREPLAKLGGEKLPVKTSLALVRVAQKLDEHLATINKVRDGLIKTYGQPDLERGNAYGIKPGDANWDKFNEEYSELMSQEVEMVIEKVGLPDTLEIEPIIVMALEKFITV